MIDIGMYVVLGFLAASLVALMLVPAFWNRAVRLTTRRIEATMPMSMADIQADKDQLRAEYAIELRRVEVALEKAKDKAIRELVEANKRRVEIVDLKTEMEAVKGRLQEKDNATRVLEQTIRRRLPELEQRLKAAKDVIAQLESANTELRSTGTNQAEALRSARSTLSVQRGDIDQLRGALEAEDVASRRLFRSDSAIAKDNRRLSAELSKLKEEMVHGKIGGRENELLSAELKTLAQQILAVAREQGTVLPEFPMPEPCGRGRRRQPMAASASSRPSTRRPRTGRSCASRSWPSPSLGPSRRLRSRTPPMRTASDAHSPDTHSSETGDGKPRRDARLARPHSLDPAGRLARRQAARELERAAQERARRGLRPLILTSHPFAAGGASRPRASAPSTG